MDTSKRRVTLLAGVLGLLLIPALEAMGRGKAKRPKTTVISATKITGGKRYTFKGKHDSSGNALLEYDGPAKGKKGSKRSRGSSSGTSRRRAGASRPSSAARTLRPPVRAPWKDRLEASRSKLGAATASALPRELTTGDDAHTFAALERAYKLKTRLPEPDLRAALESVRDAKAAHAAAYHLSRHDTPTARDALARHVARGGPGAEEVQKFLGAEGETLVAQAKNRMERREDWMNDAATGRPGSASQTEAIRALAGEPGRDVSALLGQLAGDQNEAVATHATAALEKRKQAGLWH